jgi:hypothetical protein
MLVSVNDAAAKCKGAKQEFVVGALPQDVAGLAFPLRIFLP